MDTFSRNVAIIGSAVYGGILLIGLLLFALGRSGEPFYRHPSTNVAIFSVFWFAFSPSLLFMGATVPWLCALYGSRAAALTFAVVPGGLFVLVGAYWIVVTDKYENTYTLFQLSRASPWSRNAVNIDYAAPAYRAGGVGNADVADHFPSPAAIAELMQRAGVNTMFPYTHYPSPGRWLPSNRELGIPRGLGTPEFTHLAAAASPPLPQLMSSNGTGCAPAGSADAVHPGYGPSVAIPSTYYYNCAVPANSIYGGDSGDCRGPQSAYSHSPSPIPMQPPARQRQHPGDHYIA